VVDRRVGGGVRGCTRFSRTEPDAMGRFSPAPRWPVALFDTKLCFWRCYRIGLVPGEPCVSGRVVMQILLGRGGNVFVPVLWLREPRPILVDGCPAG